MCLFLNAHAGEMHFGKTIHVVLNPEPDMGSVKVFRDNPRTHQREEATLQQLLPGEDWRYLGVFFTAAMDFDPQFKRLTKALRYMLATLRSHDLSPALLAYCINVVIIPRMMWALHTAVPSDKDLKLWDDMVRKQCARILGVPTRGAGSHLHLPLAEGGSIGVFSLRDVWHALAAQDLEVAANSTHAIVRESTLARLTDPKSAVSRIRTAMAAIGFTFVSRSHCDVAAADVARRGAFAVPVPPPGQCRPTTLDATGGHLVDFDFARPMATAAQNHPIYAMATDGSGDATAVRVPDHRTGAAVVCLHASSVWTGNAERSLVRERHGAVCGPPGVAFRAPIRIRALQTSLDKPAGAPVAELWMIAEAKVSTPPDAAVWAYTDSSASIATWRGLVEDTEGGEIPITTLKWTTVPNAWIIRDLIRPLLAAQRLACHAAGREYVPLTLVKLRSHPERKGIFDQPVGLTIVNDTADAGASEGRSPPFLGAVDLDALQLKIAPACYWLQDGMPVRDGVKAAVLAVLRAQRLTHVLSHQKTRCRLAALIQAGSIDVQALPGIIQWRWTRTHPFAPALPTTLGRAMLKIRHGPLRTLTQILHNDDPTMKSVVAALVQRGKATPPPTALCHASGASTQCLAPGCTAPATPDHPHVCSSTRDARTEALLLFSRHVVTLGPPGVTYGWQDPSIDAAERMLARGVPVDVTDVDLGGRLVLALVELDGPAAHVRADAFEAMLARGLSVPQAMDLAAASGAAKRDRPLWLPPPLLEWFTSAFDVQGITVFGGSPLAAPPFVRRYEVRGQAVLPIGASPLGVTAEGGLPYGPKYLQSIAGNIADKSWLFNFTAPQPPLDTFLRLLQFARRAFARRRGNGRAGCGRQVWWLGVLRTDEPEAQQRALGGHCLLALPVNRLPHLSEWSALHSATPVVRDRASCYGPALLFVGWPLAPGLVTRDEALINAASRVGTLRRVCRDQLRGGGTGLQLTLPRLTLGLGSSTSLADHSPSSLQEALLPLRYFSSWLLWPQPDVGPRSGAAVPNPPMEAAQPRHPDMAVALQVHASAAPIAGLTAFMRRYFSAADAAHDAQLLATAHAEGVRRVCDKYLSMQAAALQELTGASGTSLPLGHRGRALIVTSAAVRRACRLPCDGVVCAGTDAPSRSGRLVFCPVLRGIVCTTCRDAGRHGRTLRACLTVGAHYPDFEAAGGDAWPSPYAPPEVAAYVATLGTPHLGPRDVASYAVLPPTIRRVLDGTPFDVIVDGGVSALLLMAYHRRHRTVPALLLGLLERTPACHRPTEPQLLAVLPRHGISPTTPYRPTAPSWLGIRPRVPVFRCEARLCRTDGPCGEPVIAWRGEQEVIACVRCVRTNRKITDCHAHDVALAHGLHLKLPPMLQAYVAQAGPGSTRDELAGRRRPAELRHAGDEAGASAVIWAAFLHRLDADAAAARAAISGAPTELPRSVPHLVAGRRDLAQGIRASALPPGFAGVRALSGHLLVLVQYDSGEWPVPTITSGRVVSSYRHAGCVFFGVHMTDGDHCDLEPHELRRAAPGVFPASLSNEGIAEWVLRDDPADLCPPRLDYAPVAGPLCAGARVQVARAGLIDGVAGRLDPPYGLPYHVLREPGPSPHTWWATPQHRRDSAGTRVSLTLAPALRDASWRAVSLPRPRGLARSQSSRGPRPRPQGARNTPPRAAKLRRCSTT